MLLLSNTYISLLDYMLFKQIYFLFCYFCLSFANQTSKVAAKFRHLQAEHNKLYLCLHVSGVWGKTGPLLNRERLSENFSQALNAQWEWPTERSITKRMWKKRSCQTYLHWIAECVNQLAKGPSSLIKPVGVPIPDHPKSCIKQ